MKNMLWCALCPSTAIPQTAAPPCEELKRSAQIPVRTASREIPTAEDRQERQEGLCQHWWFSCLTGGTLLRGRGDVATLCSWKIGCTTTLPWSAKLSQQQTGKLLQFWWRARLGAHSILGISAHCRGSPMKSMLPRRDSLGFSLSHLWDLILGLLELVWFVGPEQPGLCFPFLLKHDLGILPALPGLHPLVKGTLLAGRQAYQKAVSSLTSSFYCLWRVMGSRLSSAYSTRYSRDQYEAALTSATLPIPQWLTLGETRAVTSYSQ